ncbi:NADH-ubiquinone oxidoreductase 12 kDa subunit [Sparassis latifolia]|uniref:NADH-ubiquinone oxidoreductase 12 kDa subunit, mitochondrial n=1 Tax=Sparassis crispa TaxID=139825 RepID=A0A401H1D4_9APHY|nr:NADH-ubiquinone oxidoreductase 12 kDa subunit, mitochondrial [Sparassis crispa]GBE88246.1 NADH-ubiquinone oxidoreductase 12 kDa subunit, mitochondrial [Sparassis crispa]
MPVDEARAAELKARLKEQDEIIRESWVRAMEAKIVRDNITKCYRIEGVNHGEKCKELVDRYAVMLKENRVQGYKHIDV